MKLINKKMVLHKLKLGSASGEDEADYLTNFEKYFYDFKNISHQVLEPQIYYVIGRKGVGKSILAKYVEKISRISGESYRKFAEVKSFRNFRYHQLVEFKDNKSIDKEYLYIWKWCLLVNMSLSLIKDESIKNNDAKNRLFVFIDENFGLDVNQKLIFDKSKKIKFNVGFDKIIGLSHESTNSESNGTYLDYIESLQDIVISAGVSSSCEYILFLDDLDDGFESSELYEKSMGSLIYAVDELNRLFWRNNFKAKFVLLMRSDIFRSLSFPDLNKFKMDNSLFIDWKQEDHEYSPLILLLIHKILTSLKVNIVEAEYGRVFNELFNSKIDNRNSAVWMLDMTMGRPRDLIQMLKIICKEFPTYSFFSELAFLKTKNKYSQYLYDDIRNEMHGHKDKDFINDALSLLKGLGKNTFKITFLKHHKPYLFKQDNGEEKVKDMLSFLYRFSVVGNIYHGENGELISYSWGHREDQIEPDYNASFTIHNGLRAALKAESLLTSKDHEQKKH